MKAVGRPLEFDPDKAIDAAVDVFWHNGYEATSMDDLLEAMNLSKSSLYQTFGNKRQLFERCLNRYADRMSAAMANGLKQADSGLSFIEDSFVSIANISPSDNKGCLLANSATEFGQREPALSVYITKGVNRFASIFTEAVIKAQAEGSISTESDPRALGNYLVGMKYGLGTMMMAGMDRRTAKGMVTLILKVLN